MFLTGVSVLKPMHTPYGVGNLHDATKVTGTLLRMRRRAGSVAVPRLIKVWGRRHISNNSQEPYNKRLTIGRGRYRERDVPLTKSYIHAAGQLPAVFT